MKRQVIRLFALFLVCSVFSPNLAWSQPRYTPAQINAMLARAKANYVAKAVARDQGLNALRRRWQQGEQQLQRGFCKRVKIVKTHTFCIKSNRGHLAVYIDGRHKAGLSKLAGIFKKALQELTRAYQRVDRDSKALKGKLDRAVQALKRKEALQFDRKIKQLKEESTKRAKQLLKMEKWKKKILTKIGGKAIKVVPKVVKLLRSQYIRELHKVLRKHHNLADLRRLAKAHKVGLYSAKAHGKGIAIAIALTVAFNAANPVVKCWTYSGNAKRRCLEREIASATANMAFDIAAAIVGISVDVLLIEPLSHALAAKVSGMLAAVSAGIGAVGYPIVYGSCSIVLNGVVVVITQAGFRILFEQTLKPKITPLLQSLNHAALQGLRDSDLKCWGPKSICK